jgi:KipI family sensor histidine kinase inhibitor
MPHDARPAAPWPRFKPSADAALTVELGEGVDRELSARTLRLHRALTETPPPGVTETFPAFRSLLVQYDPLQTAPAELRAAIEAMLGTLPPAPLSSRRWLLPVCYEGGGAMDLDVVAAQTGMTRAQVIECHCAESYYVYMLGFLPGFGYLGDLPEPLRLPRRHDPRVRVPKGAVAIAAGFTAIYPLDSPGGWHIIGRSPAVLFDPGAAEPALLAPGDMVRFRPVAVEEFDGLARQPHGGAVLAAEGEAPCLPASLS